ncbi:Os08g0353050 [Oryza sativa Japonica Group]|uniref:Os08g0353050 protein n=2 Tax=Oryza sativa subsp. japonica TaxID=39947 RepID=Q6YX73_ORYSJ|nr:hypothetical protein [Oryza sativa Japonica Group]BAT05065.1 Os08g0353050 [Oryza sativa Japonica Group]
MEKPQKKKKSTISHFTQKQIKNVHPVANNVWTQTRTHIHISLSPKIKKTQRKFKKTLANEPIALSSSSSLPPWQSRAQGLADLAPATACLLLHLAGEERKGRVEMKTLPYLLVIGPPCHKQFDPPPIGERERHLLAAQGRGRGIHMRRGEG